MALNRGSLKSNPDLIDLRVNLQSTDEIEEKTQLLPGFPNNILRNYKNSSTATFFGYLSLYEKAQLAKNSQFSKFKEYRDAAIAYKLLAIEFLQHVIYGEKAEAEKLLKANPMLVFYKGVVIDYSGRRIEGTAYQIALGAEDVNRVKLDQDNQPELDASGNLQILYADEGMAEMIEAYFKLAFDGDEKAAKEEVIRQQKQQFSEKAKAADAQKALQDSAALKAVASVIMTANIKFDYRNNIQVDVNCAVAIKKFRDHLIPKNIIKSGKHFNAQLLVEAFQLYSRLSDIRDGSFVFNGRRDPRELLFWNQIIGYIQRYLPACYAQAFCQTLNAVVGYEEDAIICDPVKLERSMKCELYSIPRDDHTFFPLELGSFNKRLGFEYACSPFSVSMSYVLRGHRFAFGSEAKSYFEKYVEQKQAGQRYVNDQKLDQRVRMPGLLFTM